MGLGGLLASADCADAVLKSVLLRLKWCGAVGTLLGMRVVQSRTADGVGMVGMGTLLYVDICAIPAHVMALYSSGHAFGTNHHHVAKVQRAVSVTSIARTDGSVSGIT